MAKVRARRASGSRYRFGIEDGARAGQGGSRTSAFGVAEAFEDLADSESDAEGEVEKLSFILQQLQGQRQERERHAKADALCETIGQKGDRAVLDKRRALEALKIEYQKAAAAAATDAEKLQSLRARHADECAALCKRVQRCREALRSAQAANAELQGDYDEAIPSSVEALEQHLDRALAGFDDLVAQLGA